MKQFNKVISIEVSVDSIAKRLLDTLPEDYKHRELVTEAIIGPMASNNNMHAIGVLFNALGGFTNELNFQVGNVVMTKASSYYDYEFIDNVIVPRTKSLEIGMAVVKEVDVYKVGQQILIGYPSIIKGKEGFSVKMDEKWVGKGYCTMVADQTEFTQLVDIMKLACDDENRKKEVVA